jgi:hypothetical protein
MFSSDYIYLFNLFLVEPFRLKQIQKTYHMANFMMLCALYKANFKAILINQLFETNFYFI